MLRLLPNLYTPLIKTSFGAKFKVLNKTSPLVRYFSVNNDIARKSIVENIPTRKLSINSYIFHKPVRENKLINKISWTLPTSLRRNYSSSNRPNGTDIYGCVVLAGGLYGFVCGIFSYLDDTRSDLIEGIVTTVVFTWLGTGTAALSPVLIPIAGLLIILSPFKNDGDIRKRR